MRIKLSTAVVALSAAVMWLTGANLIAKSATVAALAILVYTEVVERKRSAA